MRAVDYQRVRRTLQAIRIERKMGVPELAVDAGLAKSTVYRLEEFDEEPDRAIDIETIEKLTTAMDLTLSEFFARIDEGLHAEPSASTDQPPQNIAATRGGAHPPLSAASAPEMQALIIAVAQNLAVTFDHAVDRLIEARTPARRARKQTATPRARTAVRDGRHRKMG